MKFLLRTLLLCFSIIVQAEEVHIDFSKTEWRAPLINKGTFFWESEASRSSIVEDSELGTKALKIDFPKGKFGPFASGDSFNSKLLASEKALSFSYRFKFENDFEFVKGGKLPGICGGDPKHKEKPFRTVTGGIHPDGFDGFSVRSMWKDSGRIIAYIYHPDQKGDFGDVFPFKENGVETRVKPGTWYRLKMFVQMNTPGKHDGVVKAWMDGKLVFEKSNFRFRETETLKADQICFHTFYGGADASWAPQADHSILFSDFQVTPE
jgi:hypothetical protein